MTKARRSSPASRRSAPMAIPRATIPMSCRLDRARSTSRPTSPTCRSCSRAIPAGMPSMTRIRSWRRQPAARSTTCWWRKRCCFRASTIRSPRSPMSRRVGRATARFPCPGIRRFERLHRLAAHRAAAGIKSHSWLETGCARARLTDAGVASIAAAHDDDPPQRIVATPPRPRGTGARSRVLVTRAAGVGSAAHLLDPRAMTELRQPLASEHDHVRPPCLQGSSRRRPCLCGRARLRPRDRLRRRPPGGRAAAVPCDGSGRQAAARAISFACVNPLAQLAAKGGPWLIAVAGDDAYVSPHWYASPEQVPTWLYEAVQLSGPVHVVPTDHTCDHLDRLVAQFESRLAPKPPWVADGTLSPQRRATLMESIVAIEMTVETVEASFKLNQHKPDADHVAVARVLREQGEASARAIATRMVALRPHLAYE